MNNQKGSWRDKPFRCPHCRKNTKPRPEGHINPHWVDNAYTCKGK